MGHLGQSEIDTPFFTKKSKVGIVKLLTKIGDYGHQGSEPADNVFLDEAHGIDFGYLD